MQAPLPPVLVNGCSLAQNSPCVLPALPVSFGLAGESPSPLVRGWHRWALLLWAERKCAPVLAWLECPSWGELGALSDL